MDAKTLGVDDLGELAIAYILRDYQRAVDVATAQAEHDVDSLPLLMLSLRRAENVTIYRRTMASAMRGIRLRHSISPRRSSHWNELLFGLATHALIPADVLPLVGSDSMATDYHFTLGATFLSDGAVDQAVPHLIAAIETGRGKCAMLAKSDYFDAATSLGLNVVDPVVSAIRRGLGKNAVLTSKTQVMAELREALEVIARGEGGPHGQQIDFAEIAVTHAIADAEQLSVHGHNDRALECIEEASAELEAQSLPGQVLRGRLTASRARVLDRARRWEEAEQGYREGLADLAPVLGPNHLLTLRMTCDWAAMVAEHGHHERGAEILNMLRIERLDPWQLVLEMG